MKFFTAKHTKDTQVTKKKPLCTSRPLCLIYSYTVSIKVCSTRLKMMLPKITTLICQNYFFSASRNSDTVSPAERIRLRKVPLATSLWSGCNLPIFDQDDVTPLLSDHLPTK